MESISPQSAPFTYENAERYLDTVRSLFRDDEADYRGQRSSLQQEIAALAVEEADKFFDTSLLGVIALASHDEDTLIDAIPSTQEEAKLTLGDANGAVTLSEMRHTWCRLWTGVSVMTNRLGRDSTRFQNKGLVEVNKLNPEDRHTLMQTLFGQFQDINALRFGARGFGLTRTRTAHNIEEGTVERTKYDPDKAGDSREISANAALRRYVQVGAGRQRNPATHTAGKLSPKELIELRKEFPELDPDTFFSVTAFRKDAISALREADD